MSSENKAYAVAIAEAARMIGEAALMMCRHVHDGKACSCCTAMAAGLVCGSGVFPAGRMDTFMENFVERYNMTAKKFGLVPIAAVEVNQIISLSPPLDPERN